MEVIKGKVKIPKAYFNRSAKREYVFWPRAVIREFLQNSVDAGSTSIRFSFNKDRLSLVVVDDGCGMDKDVILDKLLVLGGTHKEQGDIGGFGKAKEVLFFAWQSYAIHTKNLLVKGEGSEYTVEKIGKYFNGTRCVIRFYDEVEFNSVLTSAMEYLPRNEVKPEIYLNSNKVLYAFGDKKKVRSLDFCTIYSSPDSSSSISIRVNGLEMFKFYNEIKLNSQIFVELKDYSTDILTSNRDALNYKFSNELSGIIKGISINSISSFINFSNDIEEVMGGNEVIIPDSLLLTWSEKVFNKPEFSTPKNKSNFFFKNFNYQFLIRRSGSYNVDDIIKFMNDVSAEPFAFLWTSLVFEVIIANKIPIRGFMPGFVFHERVRALKNGKTDFPSIFINPLSKSISKCKDIQQLKEVMEDLAYHEVSHIGNNNHNELFVLRMEAIRENHRIWKRENFSVNVLNWRKIIKEGY